MSQVNLRLRFSNFISAIAIIFSIVLTGAAAGGNGFSLFGLSSERQSNGLWNVDEMLGSSNQTYNATSEFSLTQGGTSGVWRYGYTANDTSNAFAEYTLNNTLPCGGQPAQSWTFSASGDRTPVLARFLAPTACNGTPPEALYLHPGPGGQRSVLRWVAPAAGTFQITGAMQKADPSGSTDFRVLKNQTGTPLFSGTLSANYHQAFDFIVTVAANDTIDFSLGFGNGIYNSDGVALAVTVSQPAVACLTAPANLQVFVPGENSPSDVQSPNTNASLVGNATYTNTGKVGRAFELNGSGDYVRIEDNAAQRPATAVTAEGWFKFDSASGVVSLISKPIRNSNLNSYTLYLDGGQLRGLVGNASQFTRALSSFTPQTGVWHHLAFTYELSGTSTLKLYANGVEVTSGVDGTANLPITYDANPYPLLIGGEFENNAPGFTLDGQADEVSVYGRALSQTELFNITKQGSFGKCPPASCVQSPNNLVSWFAGEQNALDSRSNNHGTLQNGATFATGKVGQAFSLDGVDDRILIADPVPASLQIQNDISLNAWIYVTEYPTTGERLGMIVGSQYDVTASGASIFLDGRTNPDGQPAPPGHIHFQIGDGSFHVTNAQTAVPLNQWVHISANRKGGENARIYYNGVLQPSTSAPWAGTITYNGAWFAIGQQKDINRPFKGLIDEVSVFNRSLTQPEVQSVVNADSSGMCKPSPLNPTTNQIVWFSGDGDTRDFLGLNPNGILRGDANFKVGRVGQSFNFDGNGDYVEIADDADHKPANITVEGWFKVNSLSGVPHFVSKPLRDTTSNSYVVWYQDGQLRGAHGNNSGGFDMLATGFSPNLGTWYHFAYTIDDAANTHRFFVNGVQIATAATNLPISYDTTPHPLLIGGELDNNTLGSFLNGQTDEVSLYSSALTVSEITAVYNAGVAGKSKSKTTATGGNVQTQLSDATVTFANVSVAGTTSQSGIDLGSLPALPSSATFTGLAYNISTTAAYQNGTADDVRVCFNLPSLASIGASGLRVLHLENGAWADRTASGNTLTNFCTDNLTSLSPFVIVEGTAPSATYSIGGQITSGSGLANVSVALSGGATSTATTDASGNYSFANLAAGGNYTVTPTLANYTFTPTNHVYNDLAANVGDANFTAAIPALTISDVTVTEGSTGTKPFNFTVQLSNPSSQPITVNVATSDGTATVADSDYQPISTGTNIAPSGTASQSSTSYGGLASRANDGNTDGNFYNNSVSNTAGQSQPYWDLDLGAGNAAQTIDRINVWNRTDGGYGAATVDFHVFVSDNPFTGTTVAASQAQSGVQDNFNASEAGRPTTIDIANRTGRYIRVQLESTNQILNLAEVEVFAASTSQAVTFAPGETTKTFTVNVVGDTRFESDETFTVSVTDTSSTPQTLDTATGTITNDDNQPAPASCVIAPPDLQNWYKFENSAADVFNLRPGTAQGSPTYPAGKVGQAINLDGADDSVDFGNWFNYQTFSFSMWINVAPFNEQPTYANILDNNHTGSRSWVVQRVENENRFIFGDNAGGSVSFVPAANTWQLLTVTRDATAGIKLYLDGALVGEDTTVGTIPYDGSEFLRLGRWGGGGRHLKGQIDEFDIYNRVLSQTEVQAVYNAGSAGKCSPSQCVNAPSNQTAWYRGEGNANDSQGTNNGTNNGATFVAGKVGQGIKFDGVDDRVEIPDSPSLKPQNLTVETWVKFDSLTSNTTGNAPSGLQYLVFKKNTRTTNFEGYTLLKNPDNTLTFGMANAGGLGFYINTAGFTVTTGVYYHVVGTFDGTFSRIYVNGALLGTTGGFSFTPDYDTRPVFLGTSGEANFDGKLNGVLDETSIYNRALSDSEIQSIYNAGQNGKCNSTQCVQPPTNQVSWFRSENNANDSTGANNGTLQGGATYTAGQVGQAFNLPNSGSFVSVPDSSSLRPANFTVEGWFNFGSMPAGSSLTLFSKNAGTRNSISVFLNGGALWGITSNDTTFGSPVIGDFVPVVGQWYHVAYSWQSGGNETLYVNGVQIAANAADVAPGYTNDAFIIGDDNAGDSFTGKIDELSIYSRALAATEVQTIYGAGAEGKCITAQCVNAPGNQVAWLKGENNVNDSQGANNGTLQNGATYAAGRVGQSFNFPTDDAHVSIPDSPSLRPTNFTVEGWINFADIPAGSSLRLFAKTAPSRNSITVFLNGGALWGITSNDTSFGTPVIGDFVPVVGQWYHIAYSWQSGGNQALYVNGMQIATNAADVAPTYTSNPFIIGDNSSGDSFRGKVDELSIYNRALTTAEIAGIYNGGSAGKCAGGCNPVSNGLLNWYRGENNVNDSQGTNNGTAQGNPAYAAGRIGSGFSFNGSSSVAINRSVADDFSIELWMKSAQTGGSDSQWYNGFGLVDAEVSGTTNDFGVSLGAGKVLFGTGVSDTTIKSVAAVNDNQWHHVVATRTKSSGAMKLYVDGAEVAAGTGTTASLNAPANIRLGGLLPGFSFYNGLLDEVKIYNRALSSTEVQSAFSNNCTGGGGQCVNAPSNQAAWLKGEGNGNDSAGSNNGTVSGATYQAAKVGQGFKFDGVDDSVSIPDAAALKPANVTVEAWVKFDSLTSNTTGGAPNGTQFLVFKKNSRTTQFEGYSLVKENNNRLSFAVSSSSGTPLIANGTTAVTTGVFYHIVGTYDGTASRLYVNGQLEGTTNGSITLNYDTRPVFLGTSGEIYDGKFNGVLDETTIYSRAISLAEIQTIYNAGSAGKCAGGATTYSIGGRVTSGASGLSGVSVALTGGATTTVTTDANGNYTFPNLAAGGNYTVTPTLGSFTFIPANRPYNDLTASVTTADFAAATNCVTAVNPTSANHGVLGGEYTFAVTAPAGCNWTATSNQSWLQVIGNASGTGNGTVTYLVNSNYVVPQVTRTGTINVGGQAFTVTQAGGESCGFFIDKDFVTIPAAGGSGSFNVTTGTFCAWQAASPDSWITISNTSVRNGEGTVNFTVAPYTGTTSRTGTITVDDLTFYVTQAAGSAAVPNGIVAWYAGDGDARDRSGASNGAFTGTAAYANEYVGQGFSLSGSNRVIAPHVSAFSVQSLSVEAWISLSSSGAAQTLIVDKNGTNGQGDSWQFGTNNSKISFVLHDASGAAHTVETTTVIQFERWTHVAATFDNAAQTFKIYVNGADQPTTASGASTVSLRQNTSPLNIGTSFKGLIDEASIYNRALTASEINSIFAVARFGKLKQATVTNQTTATVGTSTVTFPAATSGTVTETPLDATSLPELPAGNTARLAFDISTTAAFTGNATVCFAVLSISAANFASLKVFHREGNVWIDRTAPNNVYPNLCAVTPSFSPFVIASPLAPTSATVQISGRATVGKRGIRGALVSLTEASGATRVVSTGANGTYRFTDVAAGQNVILTIRAKRFVFMPNTQVINMTEDLDGVDFRAHDNELSAP